VLKSDRLAVVTELRPSMVVKYSPSCLPAYVLFMCMRHTDHVNDDEKVRSLLSCAINGIKKAVKVTTKRVALRSSSDFGM